MNAKAWQWGVALVVVLHGWACMGGVGMAEVDRTFQEANRFYEQQDYVGAIAAYQRLLKDGRDSAAVHFNLGNAWYMSGSIGRAIYHYRIAGSMAPRDADVRANLRFARSQVGGSAPEDRFHRWIGWLTLNEWAAVSVVLFWVCVCGRIAAQLSPRLRQSLKLWVRLALLMWVTSVIALGLSWHEHFRRPIAVVVADGEVRFSPFLESQLNFTVREGAELALIEEREEWVQVEDVQRGVGWIERPSVWITGRQEGDQANQATPPIRP